MVEVVCRCEENVYAAWVLGHARQLCEVGCDGWIMCQQWGLRVSVLCVYNVNGVCVE